MAISMVNKCLFSLSVSRLSLAFLLFGCMVYVYNQNKAVSGENVSIHNHMSSNDIPSISPCFNSQYKSVMTVTSQRTGSTVVSAAGGGRDNEEEQMDVTMEKLEAEAKEVVQTKQHQQQHQQQQSHVSGPYNPVKTTSRLSLTHFKNSAVKAT